MTVRTENRKVSMETNIVGLIRCRACGEEIYRIQTYQGFCPHCWSIHEHNTEEQLDAILRREQNDRKELIG